jgi:hypothetical protein
MDFEKVSAFVNYGNRNIQYKGRLLVAERFLSPMLFLCVVLLDNRFSGQHPWFMRLFYVSVLAGICIIEYWIAQQHKKTKHNKWVLLQNAVLHSVSAIAILFASESFDYDLLPFSNDKSYLKLTICALCFFLSNFIRVFRISKGSYVRLRQREEHRWNLSGYEYATIGIFATIGVRSLEKLLGFTSTEEIHVYVFFAGSVCYFMMTGGFLKFYFATKYKIHVIPTWIEKGEVHIRQRFNYVTAIGDSFHVLFKENRDLETKYIAEVYQSDINGFSKITNTEIDSVMKDEFHIDVILNEKGCVCYELNGAPFGKLLDGKWVNFRHIQLEGEPNPEIVMIGETLLQENLRWFDDFGEYLVKSGSPIGMEIAKRYQDNNFTETELRQIEEYALNAEDITKWAGEILHETDE